MMGANNKIAERAAEIYDWLDCQIKSHPESAGDCQACGKCCDFESFDHRLFVTTPELIHLAKKLGGENIKPMPSSRCPYNVEDKCEIHENRFAGCRIFQCKADKDFQSKLSEEAIKKFKSICTNLQVPYHYIDLATGLNELSG
ncbi:MAG: hypothetical protein FVQ80_05250 [Planctomycetes bacterium]|nr:hypothetical protein [Planctomycetota bacterium]